MTNLNERIQRGIGLLNEGSPAEAAKVFKNLLPKSPQDAELQHLTALAFIQSGRGKIGRKYLDRALALSPGLADANNTLGVLLRHEKRFDEAINIFERAVTSEPDNVRALNNLSQLLVQENKMDRALQVLEHLETLEPANGIVQNLLGTTYLKVGDMQKALKSLRRSVSLMPNHSGSWLILSQLDKNISDEDVGTMRQAIVNHKGNPDDISKISTALSRVFERRKDYSISADYLLKANKIRRESIQSSVGEDELLMREIARFMDSDFLEQTKKHSFKGPTPIFVLGLPRSGTTLVEQILSSHSQVGGAGECNSVYKSLCLITKTNGAGFPGYLLPWKDTDYARLGQHTTAALAKASPDNAFVVDKTPTTFIYLGLIKSFWPDARIVHCKRDLMDCAWSNFKIQFEEGNSFAYDQDEIVRYFHAKERLMAHWREVCPNDFLDLSYEQVVSDQEGQTRRLLEFCGLPWEDACLEFHKNSNAVNTASLIQVRSPIYQTSLKAWEPYREYLQPLISGFEQ